MSQLAELSLSNSLNNILPHHVRLQTIEAFRSRSQSPPDTMYRLDHLPPRDLLNMCMHPFFDCSGMVFFVCSREDGVALANSLYSRADKDNYNTNDDGDRDGGQRRRREPKTNTALCELLALAAVGALYDSEHVPNDVRKAFFDSAKHYLDEVMELNDARTVRVLALFTLFSIMEKRITAWAYVTTGLKVAATYHAQLEQRRRNGHVPRAEWIAYLKSYRALAFLESWLSVTLGLIPKKEMTQPPDVLALSLEIDDGETSRANTMQSETAKIGVLMRDALNNVYGSPDISLRQVRRYMNKAEKWFDNLPSFMTMQALVREGLSNVSSSEKRICLSIHLLYLGTIILLTRRVLTEVELSRNREWTLDGDREEAKEFVRICLSASQQTARIIYLLLEEREIVRRCWVVIYQAFTAAVILLFAAAKLKNQGQPPITYAAHISDASKCISALEFCSSIDELSVYYLSILRPFRQALCPSTLLMGPEPPTPTTITTCTLTAACSSSSCSPEDADPDGSRSPLDSAISVASPSNSPTTHTDWSSSSSDEREPISPTSTIDPTSTDPATPASASIPVPSLLQHDIFDIIQRPWGGHSNIAVVGFDPAHHDLKGCARFAPNVYVRDAEAARRGLGLATSMSRGAFWRGAGMGAGMGVGAGACGAGMKRAAETAAESERVKRASTYTREELERLLNRVV